jgi:hypothetical protein
VFTHHFTSIFFRDHTFQSPIEPNTLLDKAWICRVDDMDKTKQGVSYTAKKLKMTFVVLFMISDII